MLGFSRSQDISWFRDRAVVFGTTSGSWDGDVWTSGSVTVVAEKPDTPPAFPNTVVVSSDFIASQASADSLAQELLDFFDENLDVKRCLVEGDETVWLGETAAWSDSWTGASGTGLITSIKTEVDNGFKMLVSVDEKCGFVWGWGETAIHISYFSRPDADLKHAYMLSSGSAWTIETVDNDKGNSTTQQGVVVDSSGYARIAYIATAAVGNYRELRHAYDGSDGWTIEVIDSGSTGLRDPSIAIDSNGYSHISYGTSSDGYLRYAYEDSGGWNTEVANATNDNEDTSLALDSNDFAHIACHEDDNRDLRYVENTLGSWTAVTVDSSGITGRTPSIAISSDDFPYISYNDLTADDLNLAYKDAGGWHIEIVDNGSGFGVGIYSSIAFDSGGTIHISYYDTSNSALKHAVGTPGSWNTEIVHNYADTGKTTSLAIDGADVVHISYHDDTGNWTKYAVGNFGDWSIETIDVSTSLWTSIAIG